MSVLEQRVATAVQKVEAAKTEVAKASVQTPAGEQMVQKVEAAPTPAVPAIPAAATPVVPAAATKPDSDPRKDYINLAKMEARLQAERRQLKAEREAFQKRQTEAGERDQYYADLQKRAKTDPGAVAKELGLDYGSWTAQILNNGEATPDQKYQALVEQIQELRDEAQNERDQARQNQAKRLNSEAISTVQNFRGEINGFIESNADAYEGIRVFGIQDLVYQLIREHFRTQGKLLGVKEASDLLEESVVGAASKFYESKKWAARQVKGTPAAKAAPQESKQETPREVRTVSNEMSGEAGTPTPTGRRLTKAEAMERAIANFESKRAART